MDKSIRISPESHAALKKHVLEAGTLKAAATRAIGSLDGVYVVIATLREGTDIVEVYQNDEDAFRRRRELEESGVAGANIAVASRGILQSVDPWRPFGERWKEAVEWTPANSGKTTSGTTVGASGVS